MSVLFILVMAIAVLLFAVFLYSMAVRIIEEEHLFKALVGGFFLLYALVATGIWWLSPQLGAPSDVSGLFGSIVERVEAVQLGELSQF